MRLAAAGRAAMTFADCLGPGHRSLQALAWLARVGASPLEPLQLVMGWHERVAHDHVRRLQAAHLVARIPMRRGEGSLIVLTRKGAVEAGFPARHALRSVAPSTWAHMSACAWVSAWLQLRGRAWWSEREIQQDDSWRYEVRYKDRRGNVRVTHRPDLAVQIDAGPVAIEVELQPKVRARLNGILGMYAELCDPADPVLAGVIYVTGREDVAALVDAAAQDVDLGAPALSFRSLDTVKQQTRAAALQRRDASAMEAIG